MNTIKKDYDSAFCGNVPLHFINTIQPYGALIVLDKNNLNIIQVSENISEVLGSYPDNVMNRRINEFITEQDSKTIEKYLNEDPELHFSVNLTWTLNNTFCICTFHKQEKLVLVEVESLVKDSGFSHSYQKIKEILRKMKSATTSDEICGIVARELKKLSGFDKVMIYRFDENWNGLVIAEEKEPEMDAYLGLHFPASDVPKQARALYQQNPYRWIPDSKYAPVKLIPVLNPTTYTFTDLSDCNLRGVAAVHIEYLGNMKVQSSMSTPIIKDGKLWGLISCHHRTARYVSFDIRTAFVLLSSSCSSELSSREREQILQITSDVSQMQLKIFKKLLASGSYMEGLKQAKTDIFRLLDIYGFSLVLKDEVLSEGTVPSEDSIKEIIFWLKVNNIRSIHFSATMPFTTNTDCSNNEPCGFIAIPVDVNKGSYFVGYRPEVIQTVKWGGNPNEAISFESDNKTYHPRNSFAIWQETVKQSSADWKEYTIKAAESLQEHIIETVLQKA